MSTTVASSNSAHAHGLHGSQARQNPAPQVAAPQTPFSDLIDASASDPAPLPPPAAKPATPHGKDAKDAAKDKGPSDQGASANPPASAASNTADDTPSANVATAVADAQGATKDTTSKDDVTAPAPDPVSEAAPDPAAKQDGNSDAVAAAAAAALVAPTVTVVSPVVAVAVPVVPVATAPNATPAQTDSDTAVAAIAASTATSAAAAVAPAQLVDDAGTAGALGVATAGQGTPGQKPGKPLTAETAPNASALVTDAAQPTDTKPAEPKGPAAGPLVAANATTAQPDADEVNGAGAHPGSHAAKSTTSEKESAGARDSLSNVPADQLAGPADAAPQPSQAAPAAGQSAPAAAQAIASTAAATAANAANAPVGAAAQATAMAAVPLAGVAVEIAARASAGSNRFEIRLDPPDLGRIDVRLDVDKQGNVTSHLVVERSATLDLLRRDAPQLERALQDAGLKTGGDGLQFSLRDQGAGAQNQNFQDNGANSAARSARVIIPTDDVPPVDTARNYGRLYGLNGGLDIRV